MAEFKFSCPQCEQHLQCDEGLSGRQIQCPACNHLIRIPAPPWKSPESTFNAESGKTWDTILPRAVPKAPDANPPAP